MIPFLREFVSLIQAGEKTCTARTKRYGGPGDLIDSTAGMLRLIDVRRETLSVIRDQFWKQEGCQSPEDFEAIWCVLHPRAGFDPEKLVWLHEFEVVPS